MAKRKTKPEAKPAPAVVANHELAETIARGFENIGRRLEALEAAVFGKAPERNDDHQQQRRR